MEPIELLTEDNLDSYQNLISNLSKMAESQEDLISWGQIKWKYFNYFKANYILVIFYFMMTQMEYSLIPKRMDRDLSQKMNAFSDRIKVY